jgi:nucleoside-diphosphate-sugar epimerase
MGSLAGLLHKKENIVKRHIKECNVCVVGGCGFLGSHLVHHLINDRGCRVLVIDNLVTGRVEYLPDDSRVEFHHYDITGSESYLRRLFESFPIRWVFNYAAEPYIPVSFERPLHVCDTNAFGAMKIINAAQEAHCHGVLQVSSAEIYGGRDLTQDHSMAEDEPVVPHSSYGASKAMVDAFVQVRWREAKTRAIAMRQFNCVGEHETHPYVIPEIISQLAKGPKVRLGNNSYRDFQYAGDAVRMATELLEQGDWGGVYNMGSESDVRIYELPERIGSIMGISDVEIEVDKSRRRPWEIWRLRSDNTKLYNTITARPEVSLQEALHRTVEWWEIQGRKWPWE